VKRKKGKAEKAEKCVVLPHPLEPVTAEEVVRAFRGAELPHGAVVVYTEETDPNKMIGRGGGYLSKASFVDERVRSSDDDTAVENGGTVEVFDDPEDAAERSTYVLKVIKGVPFVAPGGEFHYRAGPVLVRLSGRLGREQRAEYEEALRSLLPGRQENGPAFRFTLIGYWRSEEEPDWPDPRRLADLSWDAAERERVAEYLEGGRHAPWAYAGKSSCRICGESVGSLEFLDGKYLWPEGLAHYVREHSVRLPQDFLEHVANWQRPETWTIDTDWWKQQK
jgi:hypothetical protein